VIAFTSPYLWYTTRATGVVALVLFTLVVSLGTLVANRVGGTSVGRFELNELHRSITVIAMVFLVIHILTTVLDSYVATGWLSAVLPMTSHYKRLAITLGAVSFDLILAVWVSSLVKVRIKNESWRALHWLSWLAFASAVAHALMTGTDTRHGAGLALVVVCAATVVASALWRFLARPTRASGRTALSPLAPSREQARTADPFPRDPRARTNTRARR
jgi:DMSO/TMAO reductase YedYZ heme-binding membrane subunit